MVPLGLSYSVSYSVRLAACPQYSYYHPIILYIQAFYYTIILWWPNYLLSMQHPCFERTWCRAASGSKVGYEGSHVHGRIFRIHSDHGHDPATQCLGTHVQQWAGSCGIHAKMMPVLGISFFIDGLHGSLSGGQPNNLILNASWVVILGRVVILCISIFQVCSQAAVSKRSAQSLISARSTWQASPWPYVLLAFVFHMKGMVCISMSFAKHLVVKLSTWTSLTSDNSTTTQMKLMMLKLSEFENLCHYIYVRYLKKTVQM